MILAAGRLGLDVRHRRRAQPARRGPGGGPRRSSRSRTTGTRIGLVVFSGFAQVAVAPDDRPRRAAPGHRRPDDRAGHDDRRGHPQVRSTRSPRSTPTCAAEPTRRRAGDGPGRVTPDAQTPGTPATPTTGHAATAPEIVVLLTDGANTRGITPRGGGQAGRRTRCPGLPDSSSRRARCHRRGSRRDAPIGAGTEGARVGAQPPREDRRRDAAGRAAAHHRRERAAPRRPSLLRGERGPLRPRRDRAAAPGFQGRGRWGRGHLLALVSRIATPSLRPCGHPMGPGRRTSASRSGHPWCSGRPRRNHPDGWPGRDRPRRGVSDHARRDADRRPQPHQQAGLGLDRDALREWLPRLADSARHRPGAGGRPPSVRTAHAPGAGPARRRAAAARRQDWGRTGARIVRDRARRLGRPRRSADPLGRRSETREKSSSRPKAQDSERHRRSTRQRRRGGLPDGQAAGPRGLARRRVRPGAVRRDAGHSGARLGRDHPARARTVERWARWCSRPRRPER